MTDREPVDPLPAAIRLIHTFNPQRLQDEVAVLAGIDAAHPAGLPQEQHRDWTSITLYPTSTQLLRSRRRFAESELLRDAPYVRAALESLNCSIQRVRLQSLGPAGVIREHTDALLGFSAGLIRMHIPVITSPEVCFCIDQNRCSWRPGELWYGDFSRPHWVENRGRETRRHLVIDAYVDDLALALFPPTWREQIRALMRGDALQAQAAELKSFAFSFRLAAGTEVPGIGRADQALLGRVCPIGSDLMLVINHEPRARLEPLTTASLSILGIGSPAVMRIERSEGRICAANVSFISLHCELPLEVLELPVL